jgi:uncharacterized protein YdeI (YjbR/CyaY-like superfamily)
MSSKPKFFKTPESLRAWFAKHGTSKTELWMGYYKKASGKGGVVYKQALDEALCVGWIDGQVKSVDDICYMQRWTPRKPKSIWSNVNTKRVQELIAEGRMTPAGMAAFERRDPKRAGIYSFENQPHEFSPAFLKRFRANKQSWHFWVAQPPGYRRTVTAYVMTAKQEATRERRLVHVISHAARGERIPQLISSQKARIAPAAKE